MTKGIGGRRPAPKPVSQMARRLEAVRERFGVPSLRAFHARLVDGWEGPEVVSYEAVRNYHYDRDAPVAYLARVAAVFPGVRLAYLVSGQEPMMEEEQQWAESREAATQKPTLTDELRNSVPEFTRLSPVVQAAVIHVAFRWAAADSPRYRGGLDLLSPLDARALEAGQDVIKAMLGPITDWGLSWQRRQELDTERFDDYCLAALTALGLSTPPENRMGSMLDAWTGDQPGAARRAPESLKRIKEETETVRRKRKEGDNA